MMKVDYSKIVLNHLFHHESFTRTELAENLDIRKNTIGMVCNELIRQNKIVEADPSRRRNAHLRINPTEYFSIGIEHKVDCLKFIILNARLQNVFQETIKMENVFQKKRAERIVEAINGFIQDTGISKGKVVGIGFSDFIPHEIGTGLKTKSIWMPGWGDINIKEIVEGELNLNTSILRCTDAHCFAERQFGACQNDNVFIVVELDEGIGLSVFMNHTYLKGSTDIFGEVGHTVYREDGEICKCGNRGCLETVAGVDAIINKIEENIEKGASIWKDSPNDEIALEDIILNAQDGNKLALLVINEAAKAIGDILAIIINVLGIKKVVLYGKFIKAGSLLYNPVFNCIKQHCIYPLNQDVELLLSELDEYGSARGAAYMVFHNHFTDSVQ
jgi:predicted NBD/HSP70 family sugar kinase